MVHFVIRHNITTKLAAWETHRCSPVCSVAVGISGSLETSFAIGDFLLNVL